MGDGGREGSSLARLLAVETAEADGKGLHGRHRVLVVHGECVFADPTELHDDVVLVLLVHKLEVLDRGLGYSPTKVEHVGLGGWEYRYKIPKKKEGGGGGSIEGRIKNNQ